MSEHLPPSSRRLRRMASDYEESFSEYRAEQLAARALARARAEEAGPRRRMAVLVGVASLMFVVIGLGYGSARSLPGDSLYGVSRTYEHLGQLVGVVDPVQERLHEVIALAERGDRELAAQIANEALDELGRQRGMTVSIPSTVATTPSTVPTPSATSPTTPPTAPDDEGSAPAVVPEDTTATTTEPSTTVDAGGEDVEDDPIKSLKLAAELLLDRVKENGEEVDDAAANFAVAVSALETDEDTTTVAADGTGTTSTSSTTSTTQPERDSSTSTTSTSSSTTSSTTSTTVPGEGSPGEDDGSGSGDSGPGPIIMPPEF